MVLLDSTSREEAEAIRQSVASAVLDAVATLAELVLSHRTLDRAYRPQPFTTEANRVAFLFDCYEALVNPLALGS